MRRIAVLLLVLLCLVGVASAVLPNASMGSLLHFNGTFASESGAEWTTVGTAPLAVINTTVPKFGSGAIQFLGGNSGLTTWNSSAFLWSGNNATMEMWVYPNGTGATQGLYAQYTGGAFPFPIGMYYDATNTRVTLYATSAGASWNLINGATSATGSVPMNQWTHIEMDMAYPNFTLYINGRYNYSTTFAAHPRIGAATHNITLGYAGAAGQGYKGQIDEFAFWNTTTLHMGNFVPNTYEYLSSAPYGPPTANFTQSPNPSAPGQLVTFTDTSTETPTIWNWTFGDFGAGNTSILQNPTHTYGTVGGAQLGVYPIFFNVSNPTGYWSNITATHTVANATPFVEQDIVLTMMLNQTFRVTDYTSGIPLNNVMITSTSSGNDLTDTAGIGYLTTAFGVEVVTFSVSGYYPVSTSYMFDSDETHEVQMTPAPAEPGQNVWYTPWQVRIVIMDYNSIPLPNTNVSASYIASTLPSTDISWLTAAFGITSTVAEQMVNSSLGMAGTTDSTGGLSFTMFKSLEYNLSITNTTSGVAVYKWLYPSDQEYKIRVPTAGTTAPNNTLMQMNGTALPVYMLNTSCYNLSMKYTDTSGLTTALRFQVKYRQNGSMLLDRDEGAPGLGMVVDNFTVCKWQGFSTGDEVIWAFNATRSGT